MIRPATAADDTGVWAILEPIFRAGETYCQPRDITREAALAYWRGGHDVFVAEEDGALVGTCYLGPNQKGGGAHVCNCGFATAPAASGRGVARRMLERMLETAGARGFRAMQFNFVVETNTRAVALWRGHGFEIVGRLPGAFDHPGKGLVDALVMHRTLAPPLTG